MHELSADCETPVDIQNIIIQLHTGKQIDKQDTQTYRQTDINTWMDRYMHTIPVKQFFCVWQIWL